MSIFLIPITSKQKIFPLVLQTTFHIQQSGNMAILSYEKSYFRNTFKVLIKLQNWYITYIFTILFSPIFNSGFFPLEGTSLHKNVTEKNCSTRPFCHKLAKTLFSLYMTLNEKHSVFTCEDDHKEHIKSLNYF